MFVPTGRQFTPVIWHGSMTVLRSTPRTAEDAAKVVEDLNRATAQRRAASHQRKALAARLLGGEILAADEMAVIRGD